MLNFLFPTLRPARNVLGEGLRAEDGEVVEGGRGLSRGGDERRSEVFLHNERKRERERRGMR